MVNKIKEYFVNENTVVEKTNNVNTSISPSSPLATKPTRRLHSGDLNAHYRSDPKGPFRTAGLRDVLVTLLLVTTVAQSQEQNTSQNPSSRRWWWENIRRWDTVGRLLLGEDPLLLSGKHEGDVVLNDDQPIAEEKVAVSDHSKLWPGGVIPYDFSLGYKVLPFEQFLITRAMSDIERRTCLSFVRRTDDHHDYVRIIFDTFKCYSNVGRRGGEQLLSLGVFCVTFYDRGNVYHELMHVIGFHHEHNRPDRDDYVDVRWNNIRQEARKNFEKRQFTAVDTLNLPYDIDSVMHYSPHAFSKIYYLLPTLVSHDRGIFFTRSRWPSKLDYAKINELYGCHK